MFQKKKMVRKRKIPDFETVNTILIPLLNPMPPSEI